MEHPDHIDELLRQRLFDAEVSPPPFVWPNIESALRKRKRRFFIWFFTGLGLIASGLAAMWFMRSIPSTATAEQFPKAQTKIETAIPKENRDLVTQKQQGIAEPEQALAESQTPQNKTTFVKSPGDRNTQTNQNTLVSTPKGVMDVMSLENQTITLPDTKTIAEKTTTNTLGIPAVPSLQKEPLTLTESAVSMPKTKGRFAEAQIETAALSPLPQYSVKSHSSLKKSIPALVPIKKFKHKKNDPKACYDFSRHPTVWLMDVYGGPSFAFKELSTSDPEYKDYVQQRLDTERPSWAFNAGVRATLLFDRHFMLRSGLHYEQITEIFEFAKLNTVVVDLQRTWNAMSGMWVEETLKVRNGTAYFKAYDRFGMLDIPLMAGMELRKGRTGFNINAGVSFNVLFWKRGAIMNTQGVPRYFTPGYIDAIDVYRSRTSLSPTASIQWFYHLQPRLRVFAEPYYRQIVQPVTVQGYPVWQQYGVGGIRLGLTKILD